MVDYNEILTRLKDTLIEIESLTSFENLSIENAKKSRKLGKTVDKYVKELVTNSEGVTIYKVWLNEDDTTLKWNAGLNLFPIFPQKCLQVLEECEKECSDKLAKSSMQAVIIAYQRGVNTDNIFIDRLKKIYRTDDLTKLCIDNLKIL